MLNPHSPPHDHAPIARSKAPERSTFEMDVAAVVAGTGATVQCLQRACDALRDPRLGRKERAVMAAILERIGKTGTAWPSRETIAEDLTLEVKSVLNALYRLKGLGYVVWEKRPTPGHQRQLVNYTLPLSRFPRADLQKAITAEIARLRESALPAGQRGLPGPQGTSEETARPAGQKPTLQAGQENAPCSGQQELSTETINEQKGETRGCAGPAASPTSDFSEGKEALRGANALWVALRGQGLTLPKHHAKAAILDTMAKCPWIARLSENEAASMASVAARAMSATNNGFWPVTQDLSECARRFFAEQDNRNTAMANYEARLPRFREWQRQTEAKRVIEASLPRPSFSDQAAWASRSLKLAALLDAAGIDLEPFKLDDFENCPPRMPNDRRIEFVWPVHEPKRAVAKR